MEITNIKYYSRRCKYDWLANLDVKIIDADKLSLDGKNIDGDKLTLNDEWNYWKQSIYKQNHERKSLFEIREKTLLDIGNRSITNDVSVLKELLIEANRMRDIFYSSKDWDKKEKAVSNNLGEELWLENYEVLSFNEKIEQMNSLINTIQTKIEYLQFKEEPQQRPDQNKETIKIQPDEATRLFKALKDGGFLPNETPDSDFSYWFGVSERPDNLKPLEWLKSKGLLAYFIELANDFYHLKHGQKMVLQPFENMFNVENIRSSINDYKKTGVLPIGHKEINNMFT